jgi:ATP-dependent Clp protease ATP-binding subunit ClpC
MVQRWLDGSRSKGRLATLPEIVSTSGAALVAGQSGFGQLEQRVHDVMAAAEAIDAVLYFDNLADLFARTSGELGDVASCMRPWLERSRVRVLGEITPELVEHHEKRHVGFFAYLNRLPIASLDATRTRSILEALAKHDRRTDPGRPTLSLPPARDAATPLCDLAERYFSYQRSPARPCASMPPCGRPQRARSARTGSRARSAPTMSIVGSRSTRASRCSCCARIERSSCSESSSSSTRG